MSISANEFALKDLLKAINERRGNVAKLWQSLVALLNPHLADRRGATAGTIEVCSEKSIMEVFRNSHYDYSVKGYGDRVAQSFGEIYLCLDDGPEYVRQSKVANEVIQSITTEESFNLALEATLAAIASLPSPGKFDIGDLGEIIQKVLADICRVWFGLPDEISVVAGDFLCSDWTPPAQCPGHFIVPGNDMIAPDPGNEITQLGQAQGQLLRKAVNDFVSRRRAKLPGSIISGSLFREFPDPADNDFLARTIVGIMVGFLPTVEWNLMYVVSGWWEVEFRKLQQEWQNSRERDPYLRACEVLEKPLKQAIQKDPVPPAVWRTAIKQHKLDGHNVNVGDKITINIAAATKEGLSKGVTDVFVMFGGDRHAKDHPTHACPGYRAAMGVLLGTIAGLMEAN